MAHAVLDASALLVMLQAESGADVVAAALGEGAAISVLNVAEVLSKLAAEGADPEVALTRIEQVDRALEVHQIERDDLIEIARLRPLTRGLGLSLDAFALIMLTSIHSRIARASHSPPASRFRL